MPLSSRAWTADAVRALPDDGQRYELVHGELLVTPAPRLLHQMIVSQLADALAVACGPSSGYMRLTSPADISWGSDSLVQPDIFVVPRLETVSLDWARVRTLVLVAEVLSPSTARHDREQKRRLYQEHGVGAIWLVDADRRQVEVWTPAARFPTIETERLIWQPDVSAEPLVTIALSELFGAT